MGFVRLRALRRDLACIVRVRIKICGLTRAEDALAAVAAGADAIGFVFADRSRRQVTPEEAASIVAALPPFVCTVGLFVDPAPAAVRAVLARVPLSLLQFHGAESDAVCASFGVPYINALGVAAPVDAGAIGRQYPRASGVMLDAAVPGRAGGTGQRFDWNWFPKLPTRPWILAGGLNPGNVAAAVRELRPYAVDVSTGVEAAAGIKDHRLLREFCAAVRTADLSSDDLSRAS